VRGEPSVGARARAVTQKLHGNIFEKTLSILAPPRNKTHAAPVTDLWKFVLLRTTCPAGPCRCIRHARRFARASQKNFSSSCAMFAAETLQRPHRAKLMELSRKNFASRASGSVAGVHHASLCAIWQSEKEATLLSHTTSKNNPTRRSGAGHECGSSDDSGTWWSRSFRARDLDSHLLRHGHEPTFAN